MKHIKEYTDEELRGLSKDLKKTGFEKPLPEILTWDDFFEETADHDMYVDVSGPVAEMTIDELLADFEERIQGIPQQHRDMARKAIKNLWKEKIDKSFS
jgi:hypothetical protein